LLSRISLVTRFGPSGPKLFDQRALFKFCRRFCLFPIDKEQVS
jgi:hypothetical protein